MTVGFLNLEQKFFFTNVVTKWRFGLTKINKHTYGKLSKGLTFENDVIFAGAFIDRPGTVLTN